jgi:hypothetical protein
MVEAADLFDVDGMPLLLDACAKTLKTLQLTSREIRKLTSSVRKVEMIENTDYLAVYKVSARDHRGIRQMFQGRTIRYTRRDQRNIHC